MGKLSAVLDTLRLEAGPQVPFLYVVYGTITVTVTEALVLHPLLKDQGRITESIRILVPVDRMKQKCF